MPHAFHENSFGLLETSMMQGLITPGEIAPDFVLTDVRDNLVRLSDFRNSKPVVLAFLRGFS